MQLGLTAEQYPLFIKDAIRGNVVLGGGCNNNCAFCFLKSKLGRPNYTNYISIEDLRNCVDLIGRIGNTNSISFGDGALLLSCEPFNHPQYLELLREINILLPDVKKKSATIGKWINPDWYDELKKSNINYHVSVNTFDKDKRIEIMKSKDDYEGMMRFLKECKDIITKISLIYTGDLDILKRDIETLYSIDEYYKNITLRFSLPDYSKFHPEEAKLLFNKAHSSWHQANRLIYSMHPKYTPVVRSLTDFPLDIKNTVENYRLEFDARIENIIKQIKDINISLDKVGFLFSESVYEYSKKYKNINKIFVRNNSNGGSYIISSFITKEDIYSAIEGLTYDLYILSKDVFDEFGRDITGNKAKDYNLNMLLG